MSTQMSEAQLDKLSIAELEGFLDGKKAMLLSLGQKKQTILGQLADIDKQLEELTGAKLAASNQSRSEAMKESWRKRREVVVEAGDISSEDGDAALAILRTGSLMHIILGILRDASPKKFTIDQIVRKVKKAKWRGRGGQIRQSVYVAIYNFNRKSNNCVEYDKVSKTYSI